MVTEEGRSKMSKVAFILGIIVLIIAFSAAPMPMDTTFSDTSRIIVIYPNLLFAVPLTLLGALLLLYGITARKSAV
jgi:heme/copper-type cytochrome/quinol oxidase subunit 4